MAYNFDERRGAYRHETRIADLLFENLPDLMSEGVVDYQGLMRTFRVVRLALKQAREEMEDAAKHPAD